MKKFTQKNHGNHGNLIKIMVLTFFCFMPLASFAQGGTTGPLTWKIESGTLTISGEGEMPDYYVDQPWLWNGYIFTKVVIEEGVTSIGTCAFNYTTFTSITIPNSLTKIGGEAFYGATGITSIVIPNSDAVINWRAFKNCSNLSSITLPSNLKIIREETFANSGLTSITIPNSVTTIEKYAFNSCEKLISVILPDYIETIEYSAFGGCKKLAFIELPYGLESIEYCTFSGCEKLTSVTIPGSITSIGMGAFQYSGLTSITIPSNVTSLGTNAFYGCDDLTSVIINDGIKSIYGGTFRDCYSLTTVTIPASVVSIEATAFSSCGSLSTITCYRTTPPAVDVKTFENVYTRACTLRVPENSVHYYKNALIWQDFEVVGMGVGIEPITNDELRITVYPNPTTGQLTIDNGQLTIKGVEIYDAFEKKQLSIVNCPLSIEIIDISNLPAGIYFVKITTETGIITKKVIKY